MIEIAYLKDYEKIKILTKGVARNCFRNIPNNRHRIWSGQKQI